MEKSDDKDVRTETERDPIRAFLVETGKLSEGQAIERDDRVYNSAMSCIELSMRPYERRLLNRAIHDAERLDGLLKERPFEASVGSTGPMFSQPEFRGFLNLIEREVQRPDADGPVPALFRSGAQLVAASYLWEQDEYGSAIQQVCHDLRASLRLLDDLLNWVEAGKRGDRIETLHEAQTRMDAMKTHVDDQHSVIRAELQQVLALLGEVRGQADTRSDGLAPQVQSLQSGIEQLHSAVARVEQSGPVLSAVEQMRLDLENKLAGLSETTALVASSQRDVVKLLEEEADEARANDDGELAANVDQLRTFVLIGLIGIGVIVILAIVGIVIS